MLDIQKAVGKEFQGKGKVPDRGEGLFLYSTNNTKYSLNAKLKDHIFDITGRHLEEVETHRRKHCYLCASESLLS